MNYEQFKLAIQTKLDSDEVKEAVVKVLEETGLTGTDLTIHPEVNVLLELAKRIQKEVESDNFKHVFAVAVQIQFPVLFG